MEGSRNRTRLTRTMAGLGLLAALAATGCTVDVAGQTLPSPYYLQDDIFYAAPGPEMKVANEAAAIKNAAAERRRERLGDTGP